MPYNVVIIYKAELVYMYKSSMFCNGFFRNNNLSIIAHNII